MIRPSTQVFRKLTADELADIQNARGFMVPWNRLSQHYQMPVEELQRQVLEPHRKSLEAQQELGLFSDELLDGIL